MTLSVRPHMLVTYSTFIHTSIAIRCTQASNGWRVVLGGLPLLFDACTGLSLYGAVHGKICRHRRHWRDFICAIDVKSTGPL